MRDPFEQSLHDLLNESSPHDDDACLERVLKAANRQVGTGDLFALIGNWFKATLIAFDGESCNASRIARRHSQNPNSKV